MNTQHFFGGNGRRFTQEEIIWQNLARMKRGVKLGIGFFDVSDTEVRYFCDVKDPVAYHVASLVGAAYEGNDFDTFVLTAENGTELVAYVYGIDALGRTEDELCRIFHDAVMKRKAEEIRT